MIQKLADKLKVPLTPQILVLTDTSKISETLINQALDNGTSPEEIDKAMDQVKLWFI